MVRTVTAQLLVDAMGATPADAVRFADAVEDAASLYEIDTPQRLAAFLAQIGHESQGLRRTSENLNYSASRLRAVWPSRFTESQALSLEHNPEGIANHVYGGRLGNREPGDGWRYRGRGLIQVTGRRNYEATTEELAEKLGTVPDFVLQPDLLENPRWAALSAGAYWASRHLNELADAGKLDAIGRAINGGDNGREDRQARHTRALRAVA
jgi:putative chitinase